MKLILNILQTIVFLSNFFINAQEIDNYLSFQYNDCVKNQCQKLLDAQFNDYQLKINFKKDIQQYTHCIQSQISCKYIFYLPFSQLNSLQCDAMCYEKREYLTEEFKKYKQCNNECFNQIKSSIQSSELSILKSFGECIVEQNGFQGFPVEDSSEPIAKDIDDYQNCIENSTQCSQYVKEYTLSSFSTCFSTCNSKQYQSTHFNSHLESSQTCIDKVLGVSDDSDSSDSSMKWSSLALTLGIISIVIGCIFLGYRTYKKKQKKKLERQKQAKAAAEQNIPIITNFQQQQMQQNLQMQSHINQEPLLNGGDINNCQSNHLLNQLNHKYSNIVPHNQDIQLTFNLTSQIDGSPIRNDTPIKDESHIGKSQFIKDESQIGKSQFVRNKVDTIFQELEDEREKRKINLARKSAKNEMEIKRFQDKQANQVTLDGNMHQQMLDQLRRNFDDVSQNLKKSIEIENNTPTKLINEEKLNYQYNNNNETQCNKITDHTSNNIQQDDNEKNKEGMESDFARNIQDILLNIGVKDNQDLSPASSFQDEMKERLSQKNIEMMQEQQNKIPMTSAK